VILGLWRYRRFIWDSAVDDLRYRYAGSGLGVFWNLVTPLVMLALYTFIFGRVLAPRTAGSNVGTGVFVLYLASGFLPWGAFTECVAAGTQSLVAKSAYLKKMPIPEQVFVAQAAVSSMLSMLLIVGLLVGCALVLGQQPSAMWLLLPPIVLLWQLFGFGLGLTLSTLNVFFRDVGHLVGVLFQIWMWSVPVVYYEELLPAIYRRLLVLNPAYPFLHAVRDVYLSAQSPELMVWIGMLAWALVATSVGFWVLGSLRSEVRDAL
jgi:lipopolysaccharide transport system permease protein